MTEQTLGLAAGLLLSLLFSYVPGLSGWYDRLDGEVKAGIMAIALLVVAAGSFALSCFGPYAHFECSQAGAWTAVEVLILALAANQATYGITKNWT